MKVEASAAGCNRMPTTACCYKWWLLSNPQGQSHVEYIVTQAGSNQGMDDPEEGFQL